MTRNRRQFARNVPIHSECWQTWHFNTIHNRFSQNNHSYCILDSDMSVSTGHVSCQQNDTNIDKTYINLLLLLDILAYISSPLACLSQTWHTEYVYQFLLVHGIFPLPSRTWQWQDLKLFASQRKTNFFFY